MTTRGEHMARIKVGSTPTKIPTDYSQPLTIQSSTANSVTVRFGDSSVSAPDGFELAPGQAYTWQDSVASSGWPGIFVVSPDGDATVIYYEGE